MGNYVHRPAAAGRRGLGEAVDVEWETGHYATDGKWVRDMLCGDRESAAKRAIWLNTGTNPDDFNP